MGRMTTISMPLIMRITAVLTKFNAAVAYSVHLHLMRWFWVAIFVNRLTFLLEIIGIFENVKLWACGCTFLEGIISISKTFLAIRENDFPFCPSSYGFHFSNWFLSDIWSEITIYCLLFYAFVGTIILANCTTSQLQSMICCLH